ncbi:MAG TPA: carboxymuconolactone decarboxylase family protein [Chitinophagaceae bacterium]
MRVLKIFLVLILFAIDLIKDSNGQQAMNMNQPLDMKQQSIITISAFTAKGDLVQLQKVLNTGLDAGLTINEIKEVLIQLYAYTGFPRSLNALNSFIAVLKERKGKGINDQPGREPSSLPPADKNKLQFGTEMQTKLIGQPVRGEVYEFAPAIDQFLKEHLFGDIFGRDNLDWKTRELATISALAALGGAENQLRSHVNVGIYNGLTESQLNGMVAVFKSTVGLKESQSLNDILQTNNKKNMKEELKSGHPKNPYGLVYDGAITENVKGKVNIKPVTYKINDITIAANVYTPPNYEPTNKYPAIVIAHPNGGVKEQVAGLYAQHLAEQGYITITADAAYQGGSGGFPRNVDKPANRIEDIHSMADFISQFAGVDTAKIGLFGICGGGGYSLTAAQSDKRFKAVATLSMFNSGVVRRNGFMNSQLSTIQERLKQASDARTKEAAGGEVLYAADTKITDEMADKMPFALYREGHYYYNRNYAHPNSTFRYTMSSLLDLMVYDASNNMDLINQPLLMMAGSKADSYYMTEDAFTKAINAKNKELFLIEGATHIETYWKPGYVTLAVQKLTIFFGK